VPEISRFFGIIITINYSDHAPPHFHVRYGSQKAIISINGLSILAGWLSPKALALVVEWAAQHRMELRRNWVHAEHREPLEPVPPME
jgi:hypothetical protein